MKIITKLYELTLTIQFVLTILYILQNFNTLEAITYVIPISESIEFTIVLNLYGVFAFVIGLLIALVLLGIQIVGTGANDESVKVAGKLVAFVVLWLFLTIGNLQYLVYLEYYQLILVLLSIPHLLFVMQNLFGVNVNE